MNRPSVIIAAMLLASASVVAQTTQGGITPKMLQRIEQAQQGGAADKALFNAIATLFRSNIQAAVEEAREEVRGDGSPLRKLTELTEKIVGKD